MNGNVPRSRIERVKLKEFDRQLGALFGAAKGVLLCVLVTLFSVALLGDSQRQAICKSKSGHYIAVLLDRADMVIPRELHDVLAPYLDRNPSNKPEDRKFAVALFTIFLMFWAVLVMIGSFFRGPGFNFVAPWTQGLFFEL